MGGANKGDVASKTAIDSLSEASFKKKRTPTSSLNSTSGGSPKLAKRPTLIYDQAEKNPA
jgi:hypothetical protein